MNVSDIKYNIGLFWDIAMFNMPGEFERYKSLKYPDSPWFSTEFMAGIGIIAMINLSNIRK